MRAWTYEEVKNKVEQDLDLQEESFITADEMMAYCNEGIDEAEAEIHKFKVEDEYFLAKDIITLEDGESEYDMPSDIYANKIKALMYGNGSNIYRIDRFKQHKAFEEIANLQGNEDYRYLITNDSTDGIKLVLYPAARESGAYITRWYIRNAKRVTATTDVLDIPEFVNFVIQYMKVRCYEKEGHPNLELAVVALKQQRDMMVSTLGDMTPDGDNLVEMDLGHYMSHA